MIQCVGIQWSFDSQTQAGKQRFGRQSWRPASTPTLADSRPSIRNLRAGGQDGRGPVGNSRASLAGYKRLATQKQRRTVPWITWNGHDKSYQVLV